MVSSASQARPNLPPGPAESPFVQASRFGKEPYAYLDECARRLGDIFTLRLPGSAPRVIFSDPALVRQAFSMNPEDYEGHTSLFPFNIGEGSILFLDGEPHRRDRQIMMPHLHGERLRSYAPIIQKVAGQVFDRWTPGSKVALKPALQEISLSSIMPCFFGLVDRERAERFGAMFVAWMDMTFTPLALLAGMVFGAGRVRRFLDEATTRSMERRSPSVSRLLPWNRSGAAKGEILALLREDFERCRRDGAQGRTDVLALLAGARYEDGTPMPAEAAIDELITLVVAGYDSTSTTMIWVLTYVLQRPEVMGAIEEEMRRVFGDGPVDPNRMGELVYLDACIKEAMRITPPAAAVSRVLRRPMDFGGYEIPAGTILWPCVYLTHRRPDSWPEPERYRPERFLDGAAVPSSSYYPFGGGRRTCTGISFANLEMRVVLAELFSRMRLKLALERPVRPAFRGQFVAPADEVHVVVEDARKLAVRLGSS